MQLTLYSLSVQRVSDPKVNGIKIPALVFSRVAGYFSPVYNGDKDFLWNKGKTSEFKDRKNYVIPENIQ
jgi:hypothetical protein